MADEKVNREERHPISCLCAKCVEDDRLAQVEAIRRRDEEQERKEIHRQRERERRHSSRLWLKICIPILLIGAVALGAWWLLSPSEQDSVAPMPEEPSMIIDDAPAPAPVVARDDTIIKWATNAQGGYQLELVVDILFAFAVQLGISRSVAENYEQVMLNDPELELLLTFRTPSSINAECYIYVQRQQFNMALGEVCSER